MAKNVNFWRNSFVLKWAEMKTLVCQWVSPAKKYGFLARQFFRVWALSGNRDDREGKKTHKNLLEVLLFSVQGLLHDGQEGYKV